MEKICNALAVNVKLGTLLLVIALLPSSLLRADEIDDYLQAQMRWERIPGLSIAVVRDGKILRTGGYGSSNLETDTPAGETPSIKWDPSASSFSLPVCWF